jgi:hypothetical protein
MAQSLSNVYVHVIFNTKKRHPFIDDSIKQELWLYPGGICKALECEGLLDSPMQEAIRLISFDFALSSLKYIS